MNNCRLIIGIDIGTSSCKVAAFDQHGNMVASSKSDYPIYRGENGEVEQDAEDYYIGVCKAIACLHKQCDNLKSRVCAIGLTGQSPTETIIDRKGKPLRKMILWSDVRARDEAKEIASKYSPEDLFSELSCHVPVSPSWTASRLLWLSKHEKEKSGKCYKYIQAKDYVGYRLTDNISSDLWSMRSVANMSNGKYCNDYLNFLGFEAEQMPKIQKIGEIKGHLTNRAALELNLNKGIVVSVGNGDALATILGSGVFEKSGVAFDSAGTSEIIGASVDDAIFTKDIMTIPSIITGERGVRYGPTQSGSGSMDWLANQVFRCDVEKSFLLAEKAPVGCDGMFFLPYISGERAPIWNTNASGIFKGIRYNCDQTFFARSVMEGVGYSVRHVLEKSLENSNTKISVLRISGGGSKSKTWCQIKSDICGIPVETLKTSDACALGAAMTGAVAAGIYSDFSEATKEMTKVDKTIEPSLKNKKIYDEIYEKYILTSREFS